MMNFETYMHEHWGSVLAWGLGALVVLWIVFGFHSQISKFLREVWVELEKCTWPWDPQLSGLKKYKELIDSTVVVIVSTLLLAAFVTGADFVLVKVVGFITRLQI